MKLSAFMRDRNLSDEAFAVLVGGCSEFAVRKWRYGERVPRGEMLKRIRQATGGEVTANDFMPADVSSPSETGAAA